MLEQLAERIKSLTGPVKVAGGGKYGAMTSGVLSGRNGSDGSKFPGGISGSGTGIVFNHKMLRRNGRIAYHQTPQANSLVTRMADTVADTGLRLEPQPKAEILGITPEEAEVWSRNVKARFDSWAKSRDQHRSGTISFYQAQRLYQIFQHRDNDIFTRLYYSDDKKLLNPLQFEFIDPDHINGDAFTTTFGNSFNSDGIIRDAQGREKGYKVWIKSNGGYESTELPARSSTGKYFMLHGFMPEYAGQGRGLSRLGSIVQEFQKITDLSLAEIQKAIIQSSILGFVKPSKEEDAHNVLQHLQTRGGAGPAGEQFGESSAQSGSETLARGLDPLQCYDIPEVTMDRPGSMFITNLPKGQSIEFLKNSSPVTNFDAFVDAFTSYISSSKGMPIEVLLMKFGQNFSASRGALLLFWRVAMIWREEMATDFLNPIVEMWLAGEIAAGRVSAPGWSDPRLRAAWLNNMWVGPPAPDIDPGKTAKARKDNLEVGVTNIDIEARNHNGSDAESNKAVNKRILDGYAVPHWSSGYNPQGAAAGQDVEALVREIVEEMIGEE